MKYLIFTLILITTYFPVKAQEVESNYTATFWSNNSIEKINDETLTHKLILEYLYGMREFSDDMIYMEIYRFISHKSQNKHTLVYYLNTFDDLLFQPTSKSRYVPFYELIANIYLKHSDISELYKKRLIYQLENINKNGQGTIATNFRYEHDGKINHLFDLKSPFTLVIFTNSESNNCINNYKAMSKSKDIERAIDKGYLKVLMIENSGKPTEYKNEKWIWGSDIDQLIEKDDLYYTPSLPSIYLLDKDKRIYFKDASLEKINGIFESL